MKQKAVEAEKHTPGLAYFAIVDGTVVKADGPFDEVAKNASRFDSIRTDGLAIRVLEEQLQAHSLTMSSQCVLT